MNLDNNPKVTVLMPVYNGEKYLREATESILGQTFGDFEFLIINDGSTDESVKILESYRDPRIRLVHNEVNLGLIATLNKGLDFARGEYIARMDSDDISSPDRLEKQVGFMDKNPEVGVCGSWLKNIKKRRSNVWYYPEESNEIKSDLIFAASFAHPAVMIRKRPFKDNNLYYSPEYPHAEDYELWTRALKYMDFANIQEVLFFYRRHREQASNIHSKVQENSFMRASLNNMIRAFGIEPTEEEIEVHSFICSKKNKHTREFIQAVENWLNKILCANRTSLMIREDKLRESLARRWFKVCRKSSRLGIRAWRMYWKSEFSKFNKIENSKLSLFFVTCLLKVH